MFLQRNEDTFESRWIAAGLYSENAASNQIRYRVKMSNKSIEYATRNAMDVSCTSGRQKNTFLFQKVI
jgi:DNA-dependent RNA polymerase auxiliary subunit epsilon